MLSRSSLLGVAAVLLFGGPSPLAGQSLFAGRGLGLQVEARDARSQALGGVSLGLPDADVRWSSPAEALGLVSPAFVVAYQFDRYRADLGGVTSDGSTARFPLILGAFPFGERWVVTAGYGAMLDQNWAVEQPDDLIFGADTVSIVDLYRSQGGAGRARLGAGYRILPQLSLGVGLDAYTGSTQITAGRIFPGDLDPACCRAVWSYSGVGYLGGVAWRSEAFSLSAAATLGGTLEATPQDTLPGGTVEQYDLPSTISLGASGQVGGATLLALSFERATWSGLNAALQGVGGARDSWSAHAGIEWEGLTLRERSAPLRLGLRQAALPFRWGAGEQEDWATERAVTAGVGIEMAAGATRVDIGGERGTRGGDASSLQESFWRFVFSVRVIGR